MQLGNDFIIAGFVIIAALAPLYIYRKILFKKHFEKNDLSTFINEVQLFLRQNYPKVDFKYEIVEQVKNQEDSRIQQTLIIEDLVSQFLSHKYILHTQKPVHPDVLWTTYEQDAKPMNKKAPKDLPRRKEVAWRRDNQCCDRCGTKVRLLESQLMLVKRIENGGTYHFENLMTLCSDCHRILRSTEVNNTMRDLHIQDQLLNKALF